VIAAASRWREGLSRHAQRVGQAEWRLLLAITTVLVALGSLAGLAGQYRPVGVLLIAAASVMALLDLRAACVLVALTSPVVSLAAINVGFHLLPSYVILAAGVLGALARREWRRIELMRADYLLLGFIAVAVIVTFATYGTAPNTTVLGAVGQNSPHLRAFAQLAAISAMVAVYFLFRAGGREVVKGSVRALLVAAGFVALYALYQALGQQLHLPYTYVNERRTVAELSPQLNYIRVNSSLPEASPLAQFMAIPLFLGLAWSLPRLRRPGWVTRLAAAGFALGAALIIGLSESKAAIIAVGLCAALLVFLAVPRLSGRRRFALIAISCLAVVAAVLVAVALRAPGGHASNVLASERYLRLGYWDSAVHIATTHPFGVGVGNFPFWYPLYAPLRGGVEYAPYVADAHSTVLDALAETGFLGGALYLLFPVALIVLGGRRARRAEGPERALLAALTTAYAAGALMHLTYSYAYFPFEWVLAGCVGAMVATSASRRAAPALEAPAASH
jgi:hypothetical protein